MRTKVLYPCGVWGGVGIGCNLSQHCIHQLILILSPLLWQGWLSHLLLLCFPAPSVAFPACNHKMSGLLVLCAILGIGTRQPGTSVWSAVFSFSLLPYLVVSQYLGFFFLITWFTDPPTRFCRILKKKKKKYLFFEFFFFFKLFFYILFIFLQIFSCQSQARIKEEGK